MGRNSVKEDKNIYQLKREEAGFTREKAGEATGISADKIEKIENRGTVPYPDEVLAMANGYNEPSLCNHYCSKDCPIGRQYVPEITVTDLRQIVLETVVSLNNLQGRQQRLMEIAVNNTVSDDEIEDFVKIRAELERVSVLIETLQLWSEEMLADGKINREKYEEICSKLNEAGSLR